MKTAHLPQLDLPQDFMVGNDVTEDILNFYRQTCRLKAGIFVLCLDGSLKASVNLTEFEIKANDLITLVPGSIIQCESVEFVRLSFLAFSSKFMSTVNLIQSTTHYYPVMMDHPVLHLKEEVAGFIRDYMQLMGRVQDYKAKLVPELVKHILLSTLYGISSLYKGCAWPGQVQSRSEEICKKFIQLAIDNYTTQRNTAFYASRLSVSPQHLCMIIKQKTGKSVSDIIADMVIMDAKSQLKSTDLTIQEISYSLNFPNVSFFGKYFKRYVGVSPQNYRRG